MALRTVLAAEGSRWVYWDNVTASQPATQTAPPPASNLLATDPNEYHRVSKAIAAALYSYPRFVASLRFF